MNVDIAAEKVAAGGKWLDAHAPAKWWDLVDLSRLDINSSSNCILGQLFARNEHGRSGYDYALDFLGLGGANGLRYELGFSPYGGGFDEDWGQNNALLTEAWRQYVNARRIAAQEPWIQGQLVNDLAASLGQMARGEGVVARTRAEELASA